MMGAVHGQDCGADPREQSRDPSRAVCRVSEREEREQRSGHLQRDGTPDGDDQGRVSCVPESRARAARELEASSLSLCALPAAPR